MFQLEAGLNNKTESMPISCQVYSNLKSYMPNVSLESLEDPDMDIATICNQTSPDNKSTYHGRMTRLEWKCDLIGSHRNMIDYTSCVEKVLPNILLQSFQIGQELFWSKLTKIWQRWSPWNLTCERMKHTTTSTVYGPTMFLPLSFLSSHWCSSTYLLLWNSNHQKGKR